MKEQVITRKARLIIGWSIILMGVLAGYAMGAVLTPLVDVNNAELTNTNILANKGLFLTGVISWVLILICDLLTSYGVIVLFKSVNEELAKLSGWLRIIYSSILAAAIYNLIGAYIYTNEASVYLESFFGIWSLGLIIFGLHLMVLAYLFCNKQVWHILICSMLMLAGIGYFVIHFGDNVINNFGETKALLESIFMAPMILGEIGLAIYLLVKRNPLAVSNG